MPIYYVRIRGNRVVSFSQKPMKVLKEGEIIIETDSLPSNDPLLMEYKNGQIVLREDADVLKETLKNHGIYRRKIEAYKSVQDNLKNKGDIPFHLISRSFLKFIEIMRKTDSLLNDPFFVVRVLFDYSDPIAYVSELDIDTELKNEIIDVLKDLIELKRAVSDMDMV